MRDRVIDLWMESSRETWRTSEKRVYYLSLEFLIGRLMRDAMTNIGLMEPVRQALKNLNVDLGDLINLEPDAALGNGGLGRLAACFMDSMSTLKIPAYGYGIRYANGMFRQEMSEGWQVELPEDWLAHGNPWEFERRESTYEIGFGGQVVPVAEPDGSTRLEWRPAEHFLAVGFDTPIVGWRGARVNTLRLWSAQPVDPILLDKFNSGDHIGALEESSRAEAITRVLYPAEFDAGGAGTAAAAGVLLLLGLAAGHRAPPPAAIWRHGLAARQGRDPAQRHASGDLDRRADAHPDRRARASSGRRPGRS